MAAFRHIQCLRTLARSAACQGRASVFENAANTAIRSYASKVPVLALTNHSNSGMLFAPTSILSLQRHFQTSSIRLSSLGRTLEVEAAEEKEVYEQPEVKVVILISGSRQNAASALMDWLQIQ